MHSKKLFVVCLALSCTAHALVVLLVAGIPLHSSPSVEEPGAESEIIHIRLVSVTPPVEAVDIPDLSRRSVAETEDPVIPDTDEALRFVDPTEQTALQIPEPDPLLSQDEPPTLEVVQKVASRPQESMAPQPVESPAQVSANAVSYWEEVRVAIARQVRYPRSAQRDRIEDKVTLSIVLDSQGRLIRVEPVPPYADETLTRAALNAVRQAAPFEPPTFDAADTDALIAELPIRFQL